MTTGQLAMICVTVIILAVLAVIVIVGKAGD